MLSLHDLQKNFSSGLKFENGQILNSICSSKLSALEHLAIYQNSIIGAKQKALKEIYPVCHKLVGEEFFIAMINPYLSQTLSRSPDLGDYGEDFFQFIREFEPAKSLVYLSDVARLELALNHLDGTAEPLTFDFQKLVECYQKEGPNLVFQLPKPSVLISSPYPIHRIWEVCQDDFQGEFKIDFLENVTFNLLIWSNSSGLRMDPVEPTEWLILNWMQAGHRFSNICDALQDLNPQARIDEILPKMVSLGWVAGFLLDD